MQNQSNDKEIKMQILIAPTVGFEIPKPGTYRARIIEITEHPALNEDWGPQLLIKVQLDQLDSDDNPILLHYYCSQKLSRQSKLGKVVNTVIGKVPGDYSDSNRLNVADLINVPCGVLIEHVERDDGSKRAIISAWLAYEVVDRKEPPVWEKADSDSEVDEGNGNTTPSLHGHDPI